jgi:hypothetical protein
MVLRRVRQAAWATEDSPYLDVEHELFLAVRRGQLVAVSGSDAARRAVEKWLDRPPLPAIRRVRVGAINAALLRSGEAKTMWLKNTRGKSVSRPDAKTLSGLDLEAALDPIGDGNFALSSVRIEMPESEQEDQQRTAFVGTVGTTPRKSKIWRGPTASAAEFFAAVEEALILIQDILDAGTDLTNPFARLAAQIDTLDGVRGAFEFTCPDVEQMVAQDATPEQVAAAEALQSALIVTDPVPDSPDAILSVGYDGSSSGRLRASVREERGQAQVRIGLEGEPSNPPVVIDIRDKLDQVGDWSIHYMSGHAILGHGIYQERREIATFNGWRFEDMTGYRIDREKPPGDNPAQIHAGIGRNGDTSLFSWVANAYRTGTLLCDDGSGEVADFLHIEDDGTLSLIHVKAAGSTSPGRGIAVAQYEVVASQAAKNLVNLDMERLSEHFARSPIAAPAAWSGGVRVEGRDDFLESLACRNVTDPTAVVVVQPHVTQTKYRALRALSRDVADPDLHRLRMLETLLNGTMTSCLGSNARFQVIASA